MGVANLKIREGARFWGGMERKIFVVRPGGFIIPPPLGGEMVFFSRFHQKGEGCSLCSEERLFERLL